MSVRMKHLTRYFLKYQLMICGLVVLGIVLTGILLPGGIALFGDGFRSGIHNTDSIGISIVMVTIVVDMLTLIGIDFRLVTQSSFARRQFFWAKLVSLLMFTVLLTVFFKAFEWGLNAVQVTQHDDVSAIYNGYFQNGIGNGISTFVVSLLFILELFMGARLVATFFGLFTKRVRRLLIVALMILFIPLMMAILYAGFMGVNALQSYGLVSYEQLEAFITFVIKITLGFEKSGPFNPIPFIISTTIGCGLMGLLTSFITNRLQIHRD